MPAGLLSLSLPSPIENAMVLALAALLVVLGGLGLREYTRRSG